MFFYVLQINRKRFLFDLAVLQAFRDVFPRVILRGFVFHCTQYVYRMVLRLGLSTTYLAAGDTYALIRKLLTLPFLPTEHIIRAFRELKTLSVQGETTRSTGWLRTWGPMWGTHG